MAAGYKLNCQFRGFFIVRLHSVSGHGIENSTVCGCLNPSSDLEMKGFVVPVGKLSGHLLSQGGFIQAESSQQQIQVEGRRSQEVDLPLSPLTQQPPTASVREQDQVSSGDNPACTLLWHPSNKHQHLLMSVLSVYLTGRSLVVIILIIRCGEGSTKAAPATTETAPQNPPSSF